MIRITDRKPIAPAPGPNDIPFTQYLRPHGRPVDVWVERPPDIVALARVVLLAGYHYDIEELIDGTVSMTCEPNRPGPDGDESPIAVELTPNGPAVLEAVDRMIRTAAAHLEAQKNRPPPKRRLRYRQRAERVRVR